MKRVFVLSVVAAVLLLCAGPAVSNEYCSQYY